ncbi:MAG: hypothetical protein ACE5JG_01845 [Planctomycetota bacterium]
MRSRPRDPEDTLRLPAILLLALLPACAAPAGRGTGAGEGEPPAGARPAQRTIFHPFVERRREGSQETYLLRPFYYREETRRPEAAEREQLRVHVLGRLVSYRDSPRFRSLFVFPNVFYTRRKSPAALRSWFFSFFPFLFLGSDDFLVFPIAGYSRGLLGLDRMLWITPFYHRIQLGSWKAHHVLWPLISWGSDGRAGGRRRLRVAPFYGRRRHRDGSVSGFVMWPFYTYRRNRARDERGFLLFPFYGRMDTPTSTSKTILFPFYARSQDYLTGATDTVLWPFWRRAKGGDALDLRRLWPLYEVRRTGFTTTRVLFWPFYRRMDVDDGEIYGRYTWVLPFYRRVETFDRRDGLVKKKTVLWPAMLSERHSDGTRNLFVPFVLPFDSPAVRRFFEPLRPFLTLYSKRVSPHRREVSALLGMIQSERTPDRSSFTVPLLYHRTSTASGTRKVRLLAGILGWDRGPRGRSVRLLWFIRLGRGGAG